MNHNDTMTPRTDAVFDPSKPWEDQLVIISLQRCIQDRHTWVARYSQEIKEGRDKSWYLEDEKELLNALTLVLHYYKGQ
jgi:hypothetical protein